DRSIPRGTRAKADELTGILVAVLRRQEAGCRRQNVLPPAPCPLLPMEVNPMSRPLWLGLALVCSSVVVDARPALAQQTFNVSLGYFTVRGQDARVAGDVLNANRNFLTFNIKDFNGASIGGEWLVPIGRYLEAGAGVSFTRRTVPSVYTRLVNAN